MKRFYTLLVALTCLTVAKAQSFEKGAMVFQLGIDGSAYGTYWDYAKNNAWDNMSGDSLAASRVIPITFEYGLKNWLGLGANINFARFVTRENAWGNIPTCNTTDLNLLVNFHLVKKKYFGLLIGTNFGYSKFKYLNNDPIDTKLSANGSSFDVKLQMRVFPVKPVGITFDLGSSNYRYRNGSYTNNWGFNDNFDLKGKGFKIGIGLAVRI